MANKPRPVNNRIPLGGYYRSRGYPRGYQMNKNDRKRERKRMAENKTAGALAINGEKPKVDSVFTIDVSGPEWVVKEGGTSKEIFQYYISGSDYPFFVQAPPETREQQLERELRQSKSAIEQQKKWIDGVQEMPKAIVTVVRDLGKGKGLVFNGTAALEINMPEGAKVGSQVRTLVENGQAVSVLEEPAVFGRIVTVDSVVNGEAIYGDGDRQGWASIAASCGNVQAGDRVKLDVSGQVALQNLGRERAKFTVTSEQAVSWDDIGGLTEAKEALREAIEYPTLHADLFADYGQKPSKGCLLYGPPGCGKTMLAKAAATALGANGGGFIYVKGAELLSKWVGESEATVKSLFDRARDYRMRSGKTAVIFIDEAEAVLGVRGSVSLGGSLSSYLVPSFLAEMDGLDETGAFVLLSTNRQNQLDPAVVRDGRIDRRVRVGRPDVASAEQIFRLAMRGRPCESLDEVTETALRELYADRFSLYEMTFESVGTEYIRFRDMLSGAVIAGITNRAALLAMARDRRLGQRSGVTVSDVNEAISSSFREMADVAHFEILAEKIEQVGHIPTTIRKVSLNDGLQTPRFTIPIEFDHSKVQASGGHSVN